jgi:hypothetical protein
MRFFKSDFFKISSVVALTIFAAYFSATYRVSPNAGPNMAWGATGATGTGSFNNHTLFAGAAPVASNCGVTPTITSASSDNAGTVTIGSSPINKLGQDTPVSQCTLTWTTAFTTPPSMTITMQNGSTRKYGVGNIHASIAANSTTVAIIAFDDNAGLGAFTYTAF